MKTAKKKTPAKAKTRQLAELDTPRPLDGDLGARTVRLGRRELVRYAEKHHALVEALAVSEGKSAGARCMYVLDLTRYFDGERSGFVVLERVAQGRELEAACALVFAL